MAAKAWPIPEPFIANRYSVVAHGIGLCDEWPKILHRQDLAGQYDAVLEAGMTICVESYICQTHGAEGVKLEQQVLITATGAVPMSRDPMIDALRA